MPNTYTELYYHFVWSTRGRAEFLTAELEPHVFRYIRHKCAEAGALAHALNGMPDHVHLAVTVPPRLALADFIHDIKGASSRFANDRLDNQVFYWQDGYGVLSFAKRDLPSVVAYIDGQKEHHRTGKLSPRMERTSDE